MLLRHTVEERIEQATWYYRYTFVLLMSVLDALKKQAGSRETGRPLWILPAMSGHLVRASSSCIIIATSEVTLNLAGGSKKHVSDLVPDSTSLGSIAGSCYQLFTPP